MALSRFTKIFASGLLLALLFALSGCSTISVNYDYDKNVIFDDYTTYAWLTSSEATDANPAQNQLSGGLLDKRIHEAVAYEMTARNFTASESPQLLVKYHLGTEDKVQVTDWGYSYSNYYYGYGGRQVDVYQYTQGTLVLDIIDAETKTLVWRGSATGTVDGGQRSPQEMQERINSVISDIMANFPPQ
ncbi:MAG: hypothetical protein ACI9UK_002100 [Candidatus Krumholzibacteriia bacterium]|jgi:hypothetical protein